MKKLNSIAVIAALTLAVAPKGMSQGNGYPIQSQTISLPATIPAANSPTNFANPPVLDLGKVSNITPQFRVQSADGSSTTNVTFTCAWSCDGVYYDTNNTVTLTAQVLAGKPCTTCTNSLTTYNRRYLMILSENIGANSVVTNISASYDVTSSPW